MQLEILVTQLLKVAPTYGVSIYPATPANSYAYSPAFSPKAGTQLRVLDGADTQLHILEQYEKWASIAPNADPICWTATAWRTLTWWPIFLSILAVHGIGGALPLKGFGVYVANGEIQGAALLEQKVLSASESELVHYAGGQLSILFHHLHANFATRTPFHLKFAQKLYTDYIIQGLIAANTQLAPFAGSLSQAMLEARITLWLQATGLPVVRGLMALPNGKFGLNRQVCCQYYRIEGNDECADCTRIPMVRRIALMSQQASVTLLDAS